MSPGWAPAPATPSLAVISSSSLLFAGAHHKEEKEAAWSWNHSSWGRHSAEAPARADGSHSPRAGEASLLWAGPRGSVPTLPSDTFHVVPGKKGDSGRVTQEEQAHHRPEHAHWDLSAWAWEAGPGWEHLSDSWGKGHIPARYEGKLERRWRGQLQLNTARKEGKTTMLSERKGKRAFSKTASLNLSQNNNALYL